MKPIFSRISLSFAALALALTAAADSRVGLLATGVEPDLHLSTRPGAPAVLAPAGASVRMLVKVADGDTSELEALGAHVNGLIGNIVCCTVPRESVALLGNCRSVLRADRSMVRRAATDLVRTRAGVDRIHSGDGLGSPYTGRGVVFGLFDEGFDPHHVNFIDPATGRTRFSRIWHYAKTDDADSRASDLADPGESHDIEETAFVTAAEIDAFVTDLPDDSHATHVAGIAAGGYRGDGFAYYGMAPEAEIAAGCGLLYDDSILLGVKRIIEYAEEVGRPCAINLSLGNNLGHHDGTGLFVEALDELAKRAVICIAAGNEAWKGVSVRKTLTASDPLLRTFFFAKSPLVNNVPSVVGYGVAEVIGPDAEPFGISVAIVDSKTGEEVCRWSPSDEDWHTVGGADAGADECHPLFETVFTADSFIAAAQGICPDNGRFYSYIIPCLVVRDEVGTTALRIAIEVKGRPGGFYELYNNDNGCQFGSLSLPGWDNIDEYGSISDMACGFNTVCVGAYVNRTFDGYYGPEGQVAAFSSYGMLSDGRELPHICAPGQNVLASYSKPYVESENYDPSFAVQATTEVGGRVDYWGYMTGTSMATPVMAGIAALWLEADPTLTGTEVREIAAQTAIRDEFVLNHQRPTRWGGGKVDAYAGLQQILMHTGVGPVKSDKPLLLARRTADCDFELITSLGEPVEVTLVDMSGRCVERLVLAAGESRFTLAATAPGAYVLTLRAAREAASQKLLLR